MNNYTKKLLSILLITVMCVTGSMFSSLAETVEPEAPVTSSVSVNAPTNIQLTLSGLASNYTAKLTWDAVSGKKVKYAVRVSGSVHEDISKCSYSASDLKNTSTYEFVVGASVNGGPIEWNTAEAKSIQPFNVPAVTLDSITGPDKKDNILTASWTNTSGYSYSKFTIVNGSTSYGSTDSQVTSISFRGKAGTHSYIVRGYSQEYPKVYSESNKIVANKIGNYLPEIHKNFKWRATFKRKATVYKKSTGSSKLTTCKKGTRLEAIGKYPAKITGWTYPSRVKIQLSDGRTGWVKYNDVTIRGVVCTSKDYPNSLKTEYVQDFSSPTNYLIWVNQYTMRVNFYKGKRNNWKLYKSVRCVVGNFLKPLGYGSDYSLDKRKPRVDRLSEDGRPYYFINARSFHGSGYFHSRCRWADTGSIRNTICRKPTTRGCVRLEDSMAKYVYNMPTGTRVVIR